MKDHNKNGLIGWKNTGGPNFSLIAFSLVSYLTPKLGKSCLPLMEGNFGKFLAKFKDFKFLNHIKNRTEIFRIVFSS